MTSVEYFGNSSVAFTQDLRDKTRYDMLISHNEMCAEALKPELRESVEDYEDFLARKKKKSKKRKKKKKSKKRKKKKKSKSRKRKAAAAVKKLKKKAAAGDKNAVDAIQKRAEEANVAATEATTEAANAKIKKEVLIGKEAKLMKAIEKTQAKQAAGEDVWAELAKLKKVNEALQAKIATTAQAEADANAKAREYQEIALATEESAAAAQSALAAKESELAAAKVKAAKEKGESEEEIKRLQEQSNSLAAISSSLKRKVEAYELQMQELEAQAAMISQREAANYRDEMTLMMENLDGLYSRNDGGATESGTVVEIRNMGLAYSALNDESLVELTFCEDEQPCGAMTLIGGTDSKVQEIENAVQNVSGEFDFRNVQDSCSKYDLCEMPRCADGTMGTSDQSDPTSASVCPNGETNWCYDNGYHLDGRAGPRKYAVTSVLQNWQLLQNQIAAAAAEDAAAAAGEPSKPPESTVYTGNFDAGQINSALGALKDQTVCWEKMTGGTSCDGMNSGGVPQPSLRRMKEDCIAAYESMNNVLVNRLRGAMTDDQIPQLVMKTGSSGFEFATKQNILWDLIGETSVKAQELEFDQLYNYGKDDVRDVRDDLEDLFDALNDNEIEEVSVAMPDIRRRVSSLKDKITDQLFRSQAVFYEAQKLIAVYAGKVAEAENNYRTLSDLQVAEGEFTEQIQKDRLRLAQEGVAAVRVATFNLSWAVSQAALFDACALWQRKINKAWREGLQEIERQFAIASDRWETDIGFEGTGVFAHVDCCSDEGSGSNNLTGWWVGAPQTDYLAQETCGREFATSTRDVTSLENKCDGTAGLPIKWTFAGNLFNRKLNTAGPSCAGYGIPNWRVRKIEALEAIYTKWRLAGGKGPEAGWSFYNMEPSDKANEGDGRPLGGSWGQAPNFEANGNVDSWVGSVGYTRKNRMAYTFRQWGEDWALGNSQVPIEISEPSWGVPLPAAPTTQDCPQAEKDTATCAAQSYAISADIVVSSMADVAKIPGTLDKSDGSQFREAEENVNSLINFIKSELKINVNNDLFKEGGPFSIKWMGGPPLITNQKTPVNTSEDDLFFDDSSYMVVGKQLVAVFCASDKFNDCKKDNDSWVTPLTKVFPIGDGEDPPTLSCSYPDGKAKTPCMPQKAHKFILNSVCSDPGRGWDGKNTGSDCYNNRDVGGTNDELVGLGQIKFMPPKGQVRYGSEEVLRPLENQFPAFAELIVGAGGKSGLKSMPDTVEIAPGKTFDFYTKFVEGTQNAEYNRKTLCEKLRETILGFDPEDATNVGHCGEGTRAILQPIIYGDSATGGIPTNWLEDADSAAMFENWTPS